MSRKQAKTPKDISKYLEKRYYNPKFPGSLYSLEKFYDALKDEKSNFAIPKSAVRKWLRGEFAPTVHKGVRRKFPTVQVITKGVDNQWHVDLADMSKSKYSNQNDNVKYILVANDVFSRKANARVLKTKTGKEVAKALEDIFKRGKVKPQTIRSDRGQEWRSKEVQNLFQKYGIKHYLTSDGLYKANYSEIFIRWLKKRLFKHMTKTQSPKYVHLIPDLVQSYNSTKHSSTKIEPKKVTKANEELLWEYQYLKPSLYAQAFNRASAKSLARKHKGKIRPKPFHFKQGDYVRVSYLRDKFDRGYDQSWSTEVFRVKDRKRQQGIDLYKLEDIEGEEITSYFYKPELQKVTYNPDALFNIETVYPSTRMFRGEHQTLVKFVGWPKKYYIRTGDIKDI